MAKYHIKPDGEPGKCSAFLKPCPLGGSEEEHYPSKEKAREAYEVKMQQEAEAVSQAKAKMQKQRKEFFANMDKPGYVFVSKDSNEVMNADGALVDDEAIVDYDNEGNPINSIEAINARKVKLSSVKDLSGFKDPVISHPDSDEYFRPNDVVVVKGNINYNEMESDTMDTWNPTIVSALKARDTGEGFTAWEPNL